MSARFPSLGTVLAPLVLVALGTGAGLGLAEAVLRAHPNWVPKTVRVDPPVRRIEAHQDRTYDVQVSHGDLFYWMRDDIRPLQPDQDEVLARVHLVTDAHGFRNAPPDKPTYDIVTLGDSFTRARNVATPWPQRLAEYTALETLNLGEGGAGPQQQLRLLQEYGAGKRPQWVVMAWFGGNDLHDAQVYTQLQPLIVVRLVEHLLRRGKARWKRDGAGESTAPATQRAYRYPIALTIGDSRLEMAFFSHYVSWLSIPRQAIEASTNFQLATEAILQTRERSAAAGARFVLVYIPSKPHVYLPYLNDPKLWGRVLADAHPVALSEAGQLDFSKRPASPELVRRHMNAQAGALADFAATHGITLLDLTPHFQAQAGTGSELFYPYDTHWNQRGHDLAARWIADHLTGRR